MAATAPTQTEQIPMVNIGTSSSAGGSEANLHMPEAPHVHRNPNPDFEGDSVPEANPATDSEALPAYKEHDMEEPLPPYMARVRMVMRREEPLSSIMPNKQAGRWTVGLFVLAVIIIIAVSVGVRVGANSGRGS